MDMAAEAPPPDLADIPTYLLGQLFRIMSLIDTVEFFQCMVDDSALEELVWNDSRRNLSDFKKLKLEECQGFSSGILKRIVQSRQKPPRSIQSSALSSSTYPTSDGVQHLEVIACCLKGPVVLDDVRWLENQANLRVRWVVKVRQPLSYSESRNR